MATFTGPLMGAAIQRLATTLDAAEQSIFARERLARFRRYFSRPPLA
ncbi:hypothetical protein ACNKHV_06460 [Shigella flexneri]